MAKAAAKKKTANGGKKSYKKNTAAKSHRRRRKNPNGLAATIGTPKDLVTGGLAGLGSALATRQLPQMLLSTGNTGIEGYAANFVTALVSTWAAGTFFGAAAGRGALIGGMVIVLDRILSEQVSPIASYLSLSGVGDANAYSKLGTVRPGYYTHPSLLNADGSYYVPQPFTDAAIAALPATMPAGRVGAVNPSSMRRHTASGMLLSSRFQGRFNQ
jgi:hypothetical protein